MRNRILYILFILFVVTISESLYAQRIVMLDSSHPISIRGLSIADNNTAWLSGSNGTVARSADGGNNWEWMQVKGFEQTDFRDIEAFDKNTAVIMGIGEPAVILKTHDGGAHWQTVFEDRRKGMFLDAMEFWNERSGIVIGDPLEGKIFVARTFDGGDSWQTLPGNRLPAAEKGEAMFAASGTNIRSISLSEAAFVTGGSVSRFFHRDKKTVLPLLQGKETTGANSLAVYRNKKRKPAQYMVVAGGDFSNDSLSQGNCAVSSDGGVTWIVPEMPPRGYKSCVEYITAKRLIACGTSGADISEDGGMHWQQISRLSFHVCQKAKKGDLVLLAGKDGKIAKLDWD